MPLAPAAMQLYLSEPSEIEYFEEGPARRMLAAIYPAIEERGLARRRRSVFRSAK